MLRGFVINKKAASKRGFFIKETKAKAALSKNKERIMRDITAMKIAFLLRLYFSNILQQIFYRYKASKQQYDEYYCKPVEVFVNEALYFRAVKVE